MTASNGWSKDELLKKALRFAQIMCTHSKESWEYAFWSALVLELLGRAALSNVSPVLLADSKKWENIYSALGYSPRATKFTPTSIDITTVFGRLKEVIENFTPDNESFAVLHMSRRNAELHSGELPFDAIKNSAWLPAFYQTCDVLLSSLGESLDHLLGKREAKVAQTMILASSDASAKAIAKSVNAHTLVWDAKDSTEKKKLTSQATVWATKHNGHRVKCPSCKNDALVTGSPSAPPVKKISGDKIIEKQEFIPTKFECIACGLKIMGFAQLSACDLGDTYTATFAYDAAEFYTPDDPYDGYEPDFNEK